MGIIVVGTRIEDFQQGTEPKEPVHLSLGTLKVFSQSSHVNLTSAIP